MKIGNSFLRKMGYVGPLHKNSTLSRSSMAGVSLALASRWMSVSAEAYDDLLRAPDSSVSLEIHTQVRIPQLCCEGIDASFRHLAMFDPALFSKLYC